MGDARKIMKSGAISNDFGGTGSVPVQNLLRPDIFYSSGVIRAWLKGGGPVARRVAAN